MVGNVKLKKFGQKLTKKFISNRHDFVFNENGFCRSPFRLVRLICQDISLLWIMFYKIHLNLTLKNGITETIGTHSPT